MSTNSAPPAADGPSTDVPRTAGGQERYFRHAPEIWAEFPDLVAGVVHAAAIEPDADVDAPVARLADLARSRLADGSESELPQIQAWRRTFARMGLKPTQYRCAAESLLRRFRKDGSLPRIHPLVDLCNAVSLAFATPVAVFDVARITGHLQVRHATGDETYLTFSGDSEHPAAGEVVFADWAGRAHARRWTNRQSGYSAVSDATRSVLIVAEAMVGSGPDMRELVGVLTDELTAAWGVAPAGAVLSEESPRFGF